MHLLLATLLATPTPPIDYLTPDQICGLVAIELFDAAEEGIISHDVARDIERRCYVVFAA